MNNEPVTVQVFGKVLISGEHSVVYGEPALVASIDKKMTVTVEAAKQFNLISDGKDELGLVRHALIKAGVNPETVKVTIKSTIPAGMGTSAAVCAGVIKAAYIYQNKALDIYKWYQLAWECEKKAHGNSSGVDPAAVIYGGLLWYIRDKQIEHLNLEKQYQFLIVNSGRPAESTGEIVAAVAERIKIYDLRLKYVIAKIGGVTKELKRIMEHEEGITALINENGLLLEKLGVVGEVACKLSNKLRAKGGGVKVTGAGGMREGSGMLLVVADDLDKIAAMVEKWGYESFCITIGGRQ